MTGRLEGTLVLIRTPSIKTTHQNGGQNESVGSKCGQVGSSQASGVDSASKGFPVQCYPTHISARLSLQVAVVAVETTDSIRLHCLVRLCLNPQHTARRDTLRPRSRVRFRRRLVIRGEQRD